MAGPRLQIGGLGEIGQDSAIEPIVAFLIGMSATALLSVVLRAASTCSSQARKARYDGVGAAPRRPDGGCVAKGRVTRPVEQRHQGAGSDLLPQQQRQLSHRDAEPFIAGLVGQYRGPGSTIPDHRDVGSINRLAASHARSPLRRWRCACSSVQRFRVLITFGALQATEQLGAADRLDDVAEEPCAVRAPTSRRQTELDGDVELPWAPEITSAMPVPSPDFDPRMAGMERGGRGSSHLAAKVL